VASVRDGRRWRGDVRRRLGQPLGEYWDYFSADEPAGPDPDPGCPFVYLESDIVVVLARDLGSATRLCTQRRISAGMSGADVHGRLGSPPDVCLRYSRGMTRRFHRARTVCLSSDKVVALIGEWQPG
jgi:hypothetical protein